MTVISPPVFYKKSVPAILATRILAGNPSGLADSDLDFDVSVRRDKAMKAHFARSPQVKYISVYGSVCQSDYPIEISGTPMHFDEMHLTREGSLYYGSKLAPLILERELVMSGHFEQIQVR